MRTLLRSIPELQYLQGLGTWTGNPNEAFDFKFMNHAIEFAEAAGYRNMEVAFLFAPPRHLSSVRVDTLEGIEH